MIRLTTPQLATGVFLIAALAGGLAAWAGDDRPSVVYQIDFGPAASCAKGFLPVERTSADERFFWKGRKLGMRDRGGDDPVNRDMVHDAEVAEAVRRATVFLCTPEFASRIGILCDPDMPWGLHATTATGFGGLVLAELAKPGVVFLKAGKLQQGTNEARQSQPRRAEGIS